MEAHKPKSWHGPGEFFREILIIVVGVLIALGGEQSSRSRTRAQRTATLLGHAPAT
jgi:hypothetical protein